MRDISNILHLGLQEMSDNALLKQHHKKKKHVEPINRINNKLTDKNENYSRGMNSLPVSSARTCACPE